MVDEQVTSDRSRTASAIKSIARFAGGTLAGLAVGWTEAPYAVASGLVGDENYLHRDTNLFSDRAARIGYRTAQGILLAATAAYVIHSMSTGQLVEADVF